MNHFIIRLAILFVFIALKPLHAFASHAAGGEISYEWISDSTYRIYFKFYRDCSGAAEPANNTILLCYRNTCNSQGGTVYLNKITTLPDSTANGSPVTLGCPGNGTRCTNSTSTVPGYKEWWYANTITLPSRCNYWRFSVAIGNRNASINLVNAQNTVFYAEATLNNLVAQGNSSPYFSVKPVPSICINQPYTYNNGGVDPNSDSLRFEMVQPRQTNGACPPTTSVVPYVSTSPSYNLTTNPIACNNTFVLDSATGQMTFTPNATGASTMTVRINEYRNGVWIGSVMRDIQVQVIACSVTAPIVNTISSTVTGGNLASGRVEACAGVALSFCFDLKSSDTAAILVATDNHAVAAPGSSVTYNGQYTDSIRGCFFWTPSTVDTGLRVFTVTVKDSTCVSPGVAVAQTFVLPIYIWPITDIIKDTTICYGDSVQLLAVGGSNFTWSVLPGGSPVTSLSCTSCRQPYVKPTVTTQYRVSNSSVQYCSKNSDTATVTVTDIRFDTLAATSNSPICQGDTLRLYASTAPVGSGYRWTGPNSFSSTSQNPAIPGTPLSGAGNYILRSTKGLCFSNPDTTAVTVTARPAAPVLSNNGPLCTGSTLNLSASTIPGATYTWSGPNGFSSSVQNPSITNAQQINSGTYNAYTTLNGCTSTTTGSTVATVTNKPVPVPSSANAIICGGKGSITLNGLLNSTSYQLDYRKNGIAQTTTSVTSSASGVVVMANLDTGVYSQIKLTLNGCASDTLAPITIIQPNKPVITSISSNTPICQGDTLRLYSTSDSSAVTWSWTGPNGFTSIVQTPVIPNAPTAASGTYVLTATINNCVSNPDSTTVLVKPKPGTPDATNNGPLCSGDTLRLFSTTVSGATYSWAGPNSYTSSSQNPLITNADTTRSGNYIVIATINGCVSNADTTIVTVSHTPEIDSFSYTDLTACYAMDGKILLYGFVPGKLFTVYYKKDGATQTPAPYYSDAFGVISMIGLDTGTYSQIKAGYQGCMSDTIIPVHIQNPPTPVVSTATNNTPICEGDTVKLFATTSATNVAWSWSGPNSFHTSAQNPQIPNATPARSGVYSVTVTQNNCTSAPLTTTVVVYPTPDTPDAASNSPVCSGDSLYLTSTTVTGATYTWAGPNSYTAALQNPVRANADTTMTGNYIVIATVNGCPSVPDTIAVIINQTPSIDSYSYSNPTTCLGTEGSITLKGLLPSALYAVDYKKGGVTQTQLSITSTAAGRVVMSGLEEAVYSQIRVTINGCISDTIAPVILTGPVKPVITSISNNTPICESDTIKLFASSDSTGVSWQWNGPNSYTSAAQNPQILSAVPAQSGTYVLSVSKNNCTSFTDSTVVLVKPTPATPVAASNTPVCSGDSLLLTSSMVTGATYSWSGPGSYTSALQNPYRLPADTAMTGNYIVRAIVNGCISAPDTAAVVIYQTPFIDSTSFGNPTTCLGTQGYIVLKGLVPNVLYTVNYRKNGVPQTALSITSGSNGYVTMNNLSAGAYTQIRATLNGCPSNAIGPVLLRDPNTPVVSANNNSPICESDTLKLYASSDSTGVTWSWTGPNSFNSNTQNPVIPNALPAQTGVYSVTASKNGCTSLTATTGVLVKPTPPVPTATNNGPLCSGNTLQLTAAFISNASYSWSGPNSFSSISRTPGIVNADTPASGNYIVIATVDGCVSAPDTTSVIVYHTPEIDSFYYTNPTTCNSPQGTLTMTGLQPGTSYIINYVRNGVTQVPLSFTSNSSGVLLVTGLYAATYSRVSVTLNGCTSDTLTPFVLTDPSAPVIISSSNNTPICEGDTIRLFATSDSTGVTWIWNGPPAFFSTDQNPVLPGASPAQSGAYTVTASKNGCVSSVDTTIVVVKPTPATPVAGSNTPVCSGNTLSLTSTTILNAGYTWTGPNSFSSSLQNPNITNVDTPHSGNYVVTATVNGCISAADTATVVVYHTPSIDSYSYSNPVTCSGAEGYIILKGMVPNASYAVDYSKNGISQSTWAIVASATGRIIMNGLTAGTYSRIRAKLNGCTSDSIAAIILTDPSAPVILSATNNTPICEGDTIKLYATSDSTGVTWIWNGPPAFFSTSQNPTISGAVPAQSGAYTVTAAKNGCVSATDTTIVLVKPTPATPVAANNSPVCSGDTLFITSTTVTGASYGWTGPNGYTANVQNPIRANADTFMTGNYIVTATIDGCVSIADTTTATVYHTPSIDSFSYSNPVTCSGTEGVITLKGMVHNANYIVNYRKNGAAQPAWPITATATGNIIMTGLNAGTYSQIQVTLNGCISDTIAPVMLTDPSKPVITSISNNTPICQSDTIKLFAASDSSGVTWSWTGPNSYSSSLQNPVILNAQPIQSGNYILTVSKNNCISVSDTTVVLVKPTPDTPYASNNSPICSGNTLLLVADTVTGASYSWTGPLSFASTLQNPSIPLATTSMSGSYTVVATINGCASAASSTSVTVYILPAPSISNFAITNPTTCGGSNGSVVIEGLLSNTTYTLNYRKNGVPQAPVSVTTSIIGSFVISGLTAGVYTNLTVTSPNGCISDPLNPITLTDPVPPSITFDSKTNPTTCLGNEGTITVAGLIASSVYAVDYDKGITPQATVLITAGAQGKLTITGLTAGTYNNIRVTINNCESNDIDSIVLKDPNAPVATATNNTPICQGENIALHGASDSSGVTWSWTGPLAYSSNLQHPIISSAMPAQSGNYILTVTKNNCTSAPDTTTVVVKPTPATPVAGSNSPVCSGDTLFLTASAIASATYSWGGPAGFSSLQQNPNRANADTFMSGKYYVYVTVNGCESLRDTTNVIIHQTPAIANTIGANPTTCNGSDGTITLYGQLPNTTYVVNYYKNGVLQAPLSIASNSTGEVVIPGLTRGDYTRITVTLNNCPSDTTALIMLRDPLAPVITASNNSPICEGDTLRLYGLSDSTAVIWSWVGPLGFTSSAQNPVIVSATPGMSGVYTLTATKNNCTSQPVTTSVTVYPTPPTPAAGSNSPVCSDNAINLTSSTIAGAVYNWTGPLGYNSAVQNPVRTPADTFMKGYYRLNVYVNGCSSLFDSTYVVVHQTPVIDSYWYNHPVTCGGTEGSITMTGLVPNTVYNVNGLKNGAPIVMVPVATNLSGILVYTGLGAGLYTNVSVTLNGCISNFVDSVLLNDPLKPVVNATNNTPICQGDAIKLFGTSDSSGVVWSWTGPLGYSSAAQNPVIANALPTQSGVYTLTATKNNCTSLPDTTMVTVKPTPPTPVAGSNSPVCSGRTLNLTSDTIANATYAWTGPLSFTSVLQNPSISNVDTPAAGNYIVKITVNGCVSEPDTETVIIYKTPVIGGYSFTHPLTCGGTSGTITLTGLKLNTTYTVNVNKNSVPMLTTTTSNGSGQAVVTGLTAGVYTQLTVSLNNCPSDTLPAIVLKDPGAPVVTATSNTPICAYDTLRLYGTADSSGVTWSWTGPMGYTATVQNPVVPGAMPMQSGAYLLRATKNNCTSLPDTAMVVINQKPLPPIASSNSPLCTGNTLNLYATAILNATYNWTGPNSFTSSLQNPNKTNVTLADTGKYIVRVIANGCWSDPDSTYVVIYRTPVISGYTFTNPTTCGGTNGSITLLGLNANTTYAINYLRNGSVQPVMSVLTNATGQGVMTGLGAGVYTRITATLNNCPSDTLVPITLVDPRAPVITSISNNTPICQGDTIRLYGTADSSGVTWSWSGPGSYTSALQNPIITNAVPAQSGVYTLTATKNNCVSAGATTTVTVKPTPPTPVAGNNGPLCDSATLLLSASNITNGKYAWTGPLFFSDTAQNPIIIKAAVNRSGMYIVTVTVNGCKSLPDTTIVVINPIPAAPVPTTPVVYCEEDIAVTLKAVGANLLWYTGPIGGTGTPIAPIPSTTTAGTYVWYVSQTVNNCESPRAMVTVTVKTKPQPAVASPDSFLYCQYDNTLQLTATGTSLLWYTQATGGTGVATAPTPSSALSGVFNWYVSQTSANGCESNRDTVTVIIRPELVPDLAADKTAMCLNDTLVISDTGKYSTPVKYYWDFKGGNVISGDSSGPFVVVWSMAGRKTINVNVLNDICAGNDSLSVDVHPIPDASFDMKPEACADEVVQLNLKPVSNAIYTWTYDDGELLTGTGSNSYSVKWQTTGKKTVSLLVTSEHGCKSPVRYDDITIHENPVAKIESVSKADICYGDTITVKAKLNSLYAYQWGGAGSYLSRNNNEATVQLYEIGSVVVKATNEWGCTNTDSIYVTTRPCCEMYLPDAFTPNGDGRNDVFRILSDGNHEVYNFIIVNRWGQRVFETTNEKYGWDGNYKGKPQDIGTYHYYIKYRCSNNNVLEKKGQVVLVR